MVFLFEEVALLPLLSCRQIRKSYDHVEILKGVNLDIEVSEKVGLIGPNGAGKSTLTSIIAGETQPDSGEVTWWQAGIRVGYLHQTAGDWGSSNRHAVLSIIRQSPSKVLAAPAASVVASEPGDLQMIARRLGIQHVRDSISGLNDLSGLDVLSGGERTKLALSQIWSAQPELLLLDEPTNHMDLLGVEWLIEQLRAYKGAMLIISHDRHFLDCVVDRVVEIEDGRATSYGGNYSFYRETKARMRDAQLHQYEEAKRQQKRIEADILRTRRWAEKAHRDAGKSSDVKMGARVNDRVRARKLDRQAKSRIKRLERLRKAAPPRPQDEPEVRFELQEANKHGRRIITARAISKAYGGRTLFRDSSFFVLRGDKVGLLGPNGCGKTTLFRLVAGEESLDAGSIWVSPSARIGYLRQGCPAPGGFGSVLEAFGLARMDQSRVRTVLAQMGIGENLVHKPIQALSSGERIKVEVARLVLSETNLLLLDEPTNHLDIYAREQLEEALRAYDGTIIMASHDRYMLNAVCNRILVLENEQISPVREEVEPPELDPELPELNLDLPWQIKD